jgi:hypothetical protein
MAGIWFVSMQLAKVKFGGFVVGFFLHSAAACSFHTIKRQSKL